MEILINNEQDFPIDEIFIKKVAEYVLKREGVHDNVELSIAFVDEDTIRELNATYRGKDAPTDVLSFEVGAEEAGLDIEAEERQSKMPILLGDVVICPAVAAKQAKEYGQSFEREMALLLTHGILHLLGYDHITDAEADEMEEIERNILDYVFSNDFSNDYK